MAKLNKPAFHAKLQTLRPRGRTPMALSLEEAAKDLASAAKSKGEQITLVMLTDGGEDALPRRDPLAASSALAELEGINFQLVGFDINRPDWTEQLAGMARAGNGRYLAADKSDVLLAQLRQAVYRMPDSFTVRDDKDKVVATGEFGSIAKLEPGKYTILTTLGGTRFERAFWVNAGSTTSLKFDSRNVNWAKMGVTPLAAPPAAPPSAVPNPRPAAPPGSAPVLQSPATKFCTSCGTKVP
jgi:hypothetical protein